MKVHKLIWTSRPSECDNEGDAYILCEGSRERFDNPKFSERDENVTCKNCRRRKGGSRAD